MMKISVRVFTNARTNNVEFDEEKGVYKVKLKALPIEGRANKELIKVISEYFEVNKSAVKILRGESSKNKLLEIELV